jgi:carbon monoxide dehydrogenase subunit G
MIELTEASITITTPIDTVFKYVSNMENYKEWFPGVIDITSANDLSHGVVGKTYIETLSLPNGDAELVIEVDQCEINHLFLTKGNLAGILPQMTVVFSIDEENHCEVRLKYHSRNPELTPTSHIIMALREDLTIRANKGVAKLKAIMEQES